MKMELKIVMSKSTTYIKRAAHRPFEMDAASPMQRTSWLGPDDTMTLLQVPDDTIWADIFCLDRI